MEIHSNSPTSQYSFFNKTVVLHSNWGMVTSTTTLYAQVSHLIKLLPLVQNQKLLNRYKSHNDGSLSAFQKIRPNQFIWDIQVFFPPQETLFLIATLLKKAVAKQTSQFRLKCSISAVPQFPGQSDCLEVFRLSSKTITSEQLDIFISAYKKKKIH